MIKRKTIMADNDLNQNIILKSNKKQLNQLLLLLSMKVNYSEMTAWSIILAEPI